MINKNLYSVIGSILLIAIFQSVGAFAQSRILMEKERDVYKVPCEVNGLPLHFIFDTGASKVTFSLTEALFMIKNGFLSENDIKGTSFAQLANGQMAENTEVILREIKIGDFTLKDVSAAIVHELEAPLLLGQSVISQLGEISIDGNLLIIKSHTTPNSNAISESIILQDYKRGVIALELKEYNKSISFFKNVIENSTKEDLVASSYGNLGLAFMHTGEPLESIAMFNRACELHPEQYCHHTEFNKAVLFSEAGNLQKAIECYLKCINLKPEGHLTKIIRGYNNMDFDAHYRLGLIYRDKENYSEAVKHFIESLKPYDEESFGHRRWEMEALRNTSYCFFELRDFKKVIEYGLKVLEKNKYDVEAMMSVCYSYYNLGYLLEANNYAQKAADLGDDLAKQFLAEN